MDASKRSFDIRDGYNVILDENGEKFTFYKLVSSGKLKVGKSFVPAAPLVGAPFGAVFQLSSDGASLERVARPVGEAVTRVTETQRDNSNLFDNNEDNQKLDNDAIAAMKKAGKAGEEIIEALISNSATFTSKTEFSQDKYKRKKAKKYITRITLRRPTARSICQAYFHKGPERIFNLRFDSLAIMLSLANVGAGAKVLVLDNCIGIITAAVAERLGSLGHVCSAHVDKPFPLDAARLLNLNPSQRTVMCSASLYQLKQAKAQPLTTSASPAATVSPAGTPVEDQQQQQQQQQPQEQEQVQQQYDAAQNEDAGTSRDAMECSGQSYTAHIQVHEKPQQQSRCTVGSKHGASASTASTAAAAAAAAAEAKAESPAGAFASTILQGHGTDAVVYLHVENISRLMQQEIVGAVGNKCVGFSSCIVAAPKLQPAALMQQLLPLLQPSAPFVVYSPWIHPLAECMHQLQTSRQAVMLQLQESWMRPYQVLPARTHPHMTCSGTGGYMLSGTKVVLEATPMSTGTSQGAETTASGAKPQPGAAEKPAHGDKANANTDGEGKGGGNKRGGAHAGNGNARNKRAKQ